VKFAFIMAEKASYPVTVLCRMLEVSRAGFYAAQERAPSARARADIKLGVEIAAIHTESRQRYGSPRVQAELQARGHRPSRKRVARLMRQQGLAGRRRRRFRDDGFQPCPARGYECGGAAIHDGRPQRDLGDGYHLHLDGGRMAVPGGHPRPVLAARRGLGPERAHHAGPRPGGVGDGPGPPPPAPGVAVAESFFATLKVELVHGVTWATRVGAQVELFDYLEIFYNAQRRHSSLGYLSPLAFERQWEQERAA
jgi:putative transposase